MRILAVDSNEGSSIETGSGRCLDLGILRWADQQHCCQSFRHTIPSLASFCTTSQKMANRAAKPEDPTEGAKTRVPEKDFNGLTLGAFDVSINTTAKHLRLHATISGGLQ